MPSAPPGTSLKKGYGHTHTPKSVFSAFRQVMGRINPTVHPSPCKENGVQVILALLNKGMNRRSPPGQFAMRVVEGVCKTPLLPKNPPQNQHRRNFY